MSSINLLINTNAITCIKQRAGPLINLLQKRGMPVNVPPTATGKRRFRLAVETDPAKLVNYCCGLNYHVDEPPIKLKPDSEYPDWLWSLRTGPKPNSWELEKGTKEYYQRLAEEGIDREYLLKMKAPKKTKVVGKTLLEREELIRHMRFAALAHMEDDAGFEAQTMEKDWWVENKTRPRDYYLPMNRDRVIYMDKIKGNIDIKNYYDDPESTFKPTLRRLERRPAIDRKPILDSKQRYRYATN